MFGKSKQLMPFRMPSNGGGKVFPQKKAGTPVAYGWPCPKTQLYAGDYWNMKKAIWFSRHAPTEAQVAELKQRGYEIAALDRGMALGSMSMDDDGDVFAVGQALLGLCDETGAELIAGVFAAPMQEVLYRAAADAAKEGDWGEAVPCLAAWNVQRSQDGGKPTFEHRRFVQVGALSSAALRWSRGQ